MRRIAIATAMLATTAATAALSGPARADQAPLVNPGAETGDLSGWEALPAGAPIESTASVLQTSGLVTPHQGDAFFSFAAAPGTDAIMFQSVALPDPSRRVRLDGWCQTEFGDVADVSLVFLDGKGILIEQDDTGPITTPDLTWQSFTLARTAPPGASVVLVEVRGTLVAGSYMNVFYDDFLLRAVDPGDVDADGNVGLADLLAILANWGACDGCPEDLDSDGEVSFSDLLLVLAQWS